MAIMFVFTMRLVGIPVALLRRVTQAVHYGARPDLTCEVIAGAARTTDRG